MSPRDENDRPGDRPGVDSARSKVQTFLDSTAAEINPGPRAISDLQLWMSLRRMPVVSGHSGTPTNRIPRLSDTLAEEALCRDL